MCTLYIIRGLPGSGKSTLAKKLVPTEQHFEADMYFTKNGVYKFDASKLHKAHTWCRDSVESALQHSQRDVAVSNTFTEPWEYEPYIQLAKWYGYMVQVIDCHGSWKNVHDVPHAVLAKMQERWVPYAETRSPRTLI